MFIFTERLFTSSRRYFDSYATYANCVRCVRLRWGDPLLTNSTTPTYRYYLPGTVPGTRRDTTLTAAYRCWPTRRQTTSPRPPSRGSFTSCIYVVRQAFFRLAFFILVLCYPIKFVTYCVRAGRASRRPRPRGSHPIRLFLSCCHIAALTGYASIQLIPPPPFRLSAAASNNYCNNIFRLSPFPCCTLPLFLLMRSPPFRCCMCCCCCITPPLF